MVIDTNNRFIIKRLLISMNNNRSLQRLSYYQPVSILISTQLQPWKLLSEPSEPERKFGGLTEMLLRNFGPYGATERVQYGLSSTRKLSTEHFIEINKPPPTNL